MVALRLMLEDFHRQHTRKVAALEDRLAHEAGRALRLQVGVLSRLGGLCAGRCVCSVGWEGFALAGVCAQ